MNLTTAQFHEVFRVVSMLGPRTPDLSTPRWVSLKNSSKLVIFIQVQNGETVTGSALTLLQAKTVTGTGSKTLALTKVYATLDTEDASMGDTLVETSVSNNTFTPDTTDDKSLLYVIEVDATQLDVANGYDCVRVGTADADATVVGIMGLLYPVTGNPVPKAITN